MKVTCALGVKASVAEVTQSALFKSWANRFRRTRVGPVTIYATYSWGGEIRMIHMGVRQPNGFEQAVFLRGSTVDMLTVVTDGKIRCVVHVEQPRIPVGQTVISNPAGMVDRGESPAMAALRELSEEVGSHITWGTAKSMHSAVLGTEAPLLGSPGGSDEDVIFYVVEGRLSTAELGKLSKHIGGLESEGERLKLRLTAMNDFDITAALRRLCSGGRRGDLKAVLSLLMYREYLAKAR